MSAIRELIEEVRRLTFTNTVQHMRWHDEADAAEAELKELCWDAEVSRERNATISKLAAELAERDRKYRERCLEVSELIGEGIERDRADAELRAFVTSRQCLEADRHSIDPTYGHVSDECVMCVLARWAAKGGKECAWCGRVACDIEEHKQRPLRAPESNQETGGGA